MTRSGRLRRTGKIIPLHVLVAKSGECFDPCMTKEIAPLNIGFLLYPQVTQLDLTGPAEVFSQLPGARVHLVWKDKKPVETGAGFSILPTSDFESCPDLDVLCVPGGDGRRAMESDAQVHEFLRDQARKARYVTSVCTGSLILAAAGPFRGKRVACHWAYGHLLTRHGATFVDGRVVRDGNCLSGGGITAGIDFGLTLVAEIAGEQQARLVQLGMEYCPDPPFDSGHPYTADKALVQHFLAEYVTDSRFNPR